MKMMNKKLMIFQNKIGIKFKNKKILREAFTLKNYKNTGDFHNQRLEFLGDSVLGLCIVDWMFKTFPKADVGVLNTFQQKIISNENLIKLGKNLNLSEYFYGIYYEKMNADIFESLIGAIHLDMGLKISKKFIEKFCIKKSIHLLTDSQNYKGKIQSFQKRNDKILKKKFEIMNEFKTKYNIYIKDMYLIQESFTHPNDSNTSNYKRLEFLGDSVLKFVFVDYIFNKFKKYDVA